MAETNYDSQKRIWSGRRRKDFYGPDVTLGEAAHAILSLNPDKVIQVTDPDGEEMTAAQMLRNSKVLAKSLLDALGLKQDDVVGISASNTELLSTLILGAFLCGTPINPVYPDFDKESTKIIFKVTQPKVIFCDVENCEVMKDVAKELNLRGDIFLMNGEKEGFRNISELLVDNGCAIDISSLPCTHMTGDDTAAIMCSSGSTGSPKGVTCSHKALLNLDVMSNLQNDSVLFAFSSMYWVSGLLILTTSLLNAKKRVVTAQPFSPEYFQQLVEKHRITNMLSGTHHMAEVLAAATPATGQRLSSIRCILCGGSAVPEVVVVGLNKLLGDKPHAELAIGYGMTELPGLLSANAGGPGKRREHSVGKLMPNTEVRIVCKQSGERMGVGGEGIVHVRTPYKWAGYYRNPEGTQRAYVDGWLVTGDIGFFDADGYLHLLGRDNDLFKWNGMQICPSQIEGVISQLKGVLEACVFGVPDFVSGHLTACAILRTQDEHGRRLTVRQVEQHVRENLAEVYHLRGGVYFVDAFPKTGSGKTQRAKVLEMISSIQRAG